ncbi:MAG: hypothetical protein ACFE8N_10605, partial [Promethearchaeota archaeon]
SFLAEKECKIAIGIRYHNPLTDLVREHGFNNIPQDIREPMITGMNRIKENIQNIDVRVIFHSEVIRDLLTSKEFNIFTEHVDPFNIEFKEITIRVTDENFSNFSLTDNELIQPSFDPTNILIGSYVSRNKNIYQIFIDKFNGIFQRGIPLNEFLKREKFLKIDSITDTQAFVLCII